MHKGRIYFILLVSFYLSKVVVPHLHAQTKEVVTSMISTVEGVPTLHIDGKPYPPFAYMSYLGEKRYYREMAAAGVHLYNIPAYLGDRGINSSSGIGPFREAIWVGEGQYDFSSIVKDFEEIIQADSLARVVIRIHLDPPIWWEKKHPEMACLLPDGSTYRQSFFSRLWQREAGESLKYCIRWLLNSAYAKHLVGIHVAGGFTEEWFYHYKDSFYDENPLRVQEFRKWLRSKYAADETLFQQAWNDNAIGFDAALPADISGDERHKAWRDPAKERQVFDTFDFQAETMADHVAYFCGIVKETSDNRLLAGAFYGYHFFVTDPRRGHGALAKLLECKDLDYLSSPNDYNRVVGEDWPPMAAINSIQRHGKLWLAENDTRTSIVTLLKDRAPHVDPPGDYYSKGVWLGPKDMATSVSLLWKNLARMLAHGYGGWWFDMWGGWFHHAQLMNVINRAQTLHAQYPSIEVQEMRAQVALVADEKLAFYDASYGALAGNILSNRYPIAKIGAPYDQFLRTDISAVADGPYKMVWLMGLLQLTEDEQQLIQHLRKKGVTVLYTDEKGTSIYRKNGTETKLQDKLQWSASELIDILQEAGVHRYSPEEEVLYAGRGWVSLHSVTGGKRTIALPLKARVIDVIQDREVLFSGSSFEVDLKPGATGLWRIEPEKN